MIIVPFEPEHLETLELQDSQKIFYDVFDMSYAHSLKESGPCFTALENGKVLCCSGIVLQWHNRAVAWALVSNSAGKHFARIHKAVKRFLDLSDVNRIEAFVDHDFEQGHRWIQMLGFEREGYMKQFTPAGKDAVLYARIK
jgi:hypothetical protein